MNSRMWIGLCAVLALGAAGYSGPKNKDDFPKALLQARYVYVEAESGDIQSINVIPEDRRAIVDVEDALRSWNRYYVTMRRGGGGRFYLWCARSAMGARRLAGRSRMGLCRERMIRKRRRRDGLERRLVRTKICCMCIW